MNGAIRQAAPVLARLDAGYLVAILDDHSEGKARAFAKTLIELGRVNVFFIEFSSRAKAGGTAGAADAGNNHGVLLNAAISEMLDCGLTQAEAVTALQSGGYFRCRNGPATRG